MRKYFLYISLILCGVFISCEHPLGEDEIPHVPKIVVAGIIEEGKPFNLYIGRTLPVGIKFQRSNTFVPDAVTAIAVDTLIYPLYHLSKGNYRNDTLQIIKGKQYNLLIEWEGLNVSASTAIPGSGFIRNVNIISSSAAGRQETYFEASILPQNDESYTATWIVSGFGESQKFYEVKRSLNPSEPAIIKVRTDSLSKNAFTSNGEKMIRIYTYDSSYYDFFLTNSSGLVNDAIFGQTNKTVKWNVKGDGIGLFIARRDTIVRI